MFRTMAEVSEDYRTPIETLRYWRHKGVGPKSIKVGRRILYLQEDLDAWVEDLRSAG